MTAIDRKSIWYIPHHGVYFALKATADDNEAAVGSSAADFLATRRGRWIEGCSISGRGSRTSERHPRNV